MAHEIYESPFAARWSSREMLRLFSADVKFATWRKLWVALARAEMKLGLPITQRQVDELEAHIHDVNYEAAEAYEAKLRHDVMAHVHAYGDQCPGAAGIIHLGATSCFVGDNTDLIVMRDGLKLLRKKLLCIIGNLADFAERHIDLPTLGFTHLQPAQLTTVGKRAALWIGDLLKDVEELDFRLATLKLRGVKGTTGTQASFMELFSGDEDKVRELDRMIASEMGFSGTEPVTGQTYSRKTDFGILSMLCAFAQSASKFANDIRILQHMKEIEEPFEKTQIGSSAMPYKRNPMRTERICSLARFVCANVQNPAVTASVQWFERTLDDSANRRLSIAEGFLAADAIAELYLNVSAGLVVYPKVIARHIEEELPFMAAENILMRAVKKGGDRQQLHERIRVHSMEAGRQVKELGLENDLIGRICADEAFGLTHSEVLAELDPAKFIGRSAGQVRELLRDYVRPLLQGFEPEKTNGELRV